MRPGTLTLRAVALLAAGSAAIHQLRYAIGYGDHAEHALGAQPHGYLAFALPLAVALLVLTLAATLMRIARGGSAVAAPRFRTVWMSAAVALALIYGLQESLEGAGAIAHGGWIGIALAGPAGFLVALALRGSAAAPTLTARMTRVALAAERILPSAASLAARAPAARPGARAPPSACVA